MAIKFASINKCEHLRLNLFEVLNNIFGLMHSHRTQAHWACAFDIDDKFQSTYAHYA